MPLLPYHELPRTTPGTPDLGSPLRFLFWHARQQAWYIAAGVFFGVTWMLAQALLWAAVGAAIDKGMHPRQGLHELLLWAGVVLGLGLLQGLSGAVRHQFAITNWMMAAYRTVQLVGHHVAEVNVDVVDVIPPGDIVTTVMADAMRVGGAFDVIPRFIGAIVSWIVVATILLSTSVPLGLVVLLGVPVLASLTTPIMRPLHRAQTAQREINGQLSDLASDTVSGLRILRGVGGEDVFFANYQRVSQALRVAGVRVAGPQALLESGQILLPAILTVAITYLGARQVIHHSLSAGQLVAFFGYATFLTTPLRTVIEFVLAITRARVGAKKVVAILSTTPRLTDRPEPLAWPSVTARILDPVSGLSLAGGVLAAVVTHSPAEASALADRLGRFSTGDEDVLVNGTPLASFRLDDVRQHVVVSEIEPRLFSGPLRDELDLGGTQTDEDILSALDAASAHDVLEALPDGLATWVEERGRSFSGGQRQRLSLARALLTEADVLILVEPTSAVDTHTEGRVASNLRAARQGHTTLVATTSPLMLEAMDQVFLLDHGVVVDVGTHGELLRRSDLYRAIVLREDE